MNVTGRRGRARGRPRASLAHGWEILAAGSSGRAQGRPGAFLAHGWVILAAGLLAALVAAGVASWLRAGAGGAPQVPAGRGGAVPQAAGSCAVSATLVPRCGAWWGMYVPASPDGAGLGGAVARQEQRLGRRLSIVERYHDMSTGQNGTFPNPAERDLGRSHLLLFSWAPVVWST